MPNFSDQEFSDKLRRARDILAVEPVSLVIVSHCKIYRCSGKGITPLYRLITQLELQELKGAALADKVVGKAAALLALDVELSAVYADIMSKPAYDLLLRHNVLVDAGLIVEKILNRDRTGICPMESLTTDITLPENGRIKIGEQLRRWQQID
jgi:hypothetical protein